MITQGSIPLSGLRLAENQTRVSAHNTANASTDAFSRQRARGIEGFRGGVRTAIDTVDLTANERRIADILPGSQNNVNQVVETVNRISAQRSFEANVNVIRAQDQMTRGFLDILA